MNVKEYLLKEWGKTSIIEMSNKLGFDVGSLVEMAEKLNLSNIETENIGRSWTEKEESFLKEHSKKLTIREASNLLHRSHYATYQRVKLLGLKEMINK